MRGPLLGLLVAIAGCGSADPPTSFGNSGPGAGGETGAGGTASSGGNASSGGARDSGGSMSAGGRDPAAGGSISSTGGAEAFDAGNADAAPKCAPSRLEECSGLPGNTPLDCVGYCRNIGKTSRAFIPDLGTMAASYGRLFQAGRCPDLSYGSELGQPSYAGTAEQTEFQCSCAMCN